MKACAVQSLEGETVIEHRHAKGQDRSSGSAGASQFRAQGIKLFWTGRSEGGAG